MFRYMKIRPFVLTGVLAVCLSGQTSIAQNKVPEFFVESVPAVSIGSTLKAYGELHGDKAVLNAKTRELIAVAVAAQIPCEYCVFTHRRAAIAAGATQEEIKEAIGVAGFVRLLSTGLYGAAYDKAKFKAELEAMKQ